MERELPCSPDPKRDPLRHPALWSCVREALDTMPVAGSRIRRCLKAFGERISARDPDRQTAKIQICVALINRFNALGTAEIVRVD